MPYIIQGLFFQENTYLQTRMHPEYGEAIAVMSGMRQTMYTGIIYNNPQHSLGGWAGQMMDHYGNSKLSKISISENQIRFVKQYERRRDSILYTFNHKKGNMWAGEYTGTDTGTGISRCVLTEVPDEFFDMNTLLEALGKKTAHEWPETERHPEADLFEPDGTGGFRTREE